MKGRQNGKGRTGNNRKGKGGERRERGKVRIGKDERG